MIGKVRAILVICMFTLNINRHAGQSTQYSNIFVMYLFGADREVEQNKR